MIEFIVLNFEKNRVGDEEDERAESEAHEDSVKRAPEDQRFLLAVLGAFTLATTVGSVWNHVDELQVGDKRMKTRTTKSPGLFNSLSLVSRHLG